jgi:predicted nuclease with TOPRIM domain
VGIETLENNEDYIQDQLNMKKNIEELSQDCQELIENNTGLIESNAELIKNVDHLASDNQNLRSRLDQLEAMFRDFIVNENNSDQSNLTDTSSNYDEFNISADFA